MLQVGICMFIQNEDGVSYVAKPYNFYVLPRQFNKLNMSPQFVCQVSRCFWQLFDCLDTSIDFLLLIRTMTFFLFADILHWILSWTWVWLQQGFYWWYVCFWPKLLPFPLVDQAMAIALYAWSCLLILMKILHESLVARGETPEILSRIYRTKLYLLF